MRCFARCCCVAILGGLRKTQGPSGERGPRGFRGAREPRWDVTRRYCRQVEAADDG